jgi:phage baseplate assembly protein W
MVQLTNFQTSLSSATWIDASSTFTLDTKPDLLPDALAVNNSLYNLFNCPVGGRGRIFQPEYGTYWYQFLQEPIDQVTANQMKISMIQAIARWEPRINIDTSNSFIQPDFSLPGYNVRIAFDIPLSFLKQQTLSFNLLQ